MTLTQPVVIVAVSVYAAHPVWQVGHTGGPVTVTVGVVGHLVLLQGTVSVSVVRCRHIGYGGHGFGIFGQ